MKNILILLAILVITSVELVAQSVPEGMRFQAVARDIKGDLMANDKLEVKVELYASRLQDSVVFAEVHHVSSNELGLLDFIIGEGAVFTGEFSKIPWAEEKLWVRVSAKTVADDEYQVMSSGQLYSVPYAMYANTAGTVVESGDEDTSDGGGSRGPLDQTAIYWALDGNANSHAVKPVGPAVLGTKDRKSITMITNNIPRLIIDANGHISFLFPISFQGDLTVNGNTTINGSLDVTGINPTHLSGTLVVDKATTLNDSLLVDNMAPVQLTGPTAVEKDMFVQGATTVKAPLDVIGMPTHLSGTLVTDKETTLNASLTVTGMSATQLTGSLDVDQSMNVDGATTLNHTLDVTGMSATHLTGIFTVAKTAILNAALTVANAAPTHLTGSLDVDGATNIGGDFTLNGKLEVTGMQPTTMTGTLRVDKLGTLDSGLRVNGGGTVGPGSEYLAYFNNEGGGSGDGIAIKLANTQVDKQTNFMTFYKGASSVAGRIEGYDIGDLADIPAPTTDEIWSAVCVGIADYNPLTIIWTQTATAFNLFSGLWNNTTIPSFDIPDIPAFAIPDVPALTIPDVPAFVISDVPSFVITDVPGFTIPDIPGLTIGPLLCSNICFCPCEDLSWDCCCTDVCLIPGSFTVWPAITIPDFPGIPIPDFPGIPIPDFPGIPIPDFPGIAIPDFPGLVIPAVPEINLVQVFGECPTIPTFSDILVSQGVCPDIDILNLNDGYIKRLAGWAFEHRLQSLVSADPIKLLGNALAWGLTTAVLQNGTVYGSKGADYAEYLPKMYEAEQFMKGEVVGVYNGKISKNTTNADQILAITSQPMVLGNMQDEAIIDEFEQVAFLGQIPVFVNGPVHAGDYIVASGRNDGVANAVSREAITSEMLSTVLGTAWDSHEGDGVVLINTSIGLRPMEIAEVLKKQNAVESGLQEQVEAHRTGSDQLTSDIEMIKRAVYTP